MEEFGCKFTVLFFSENDKNHLRLILIHYRRIPAL